ncbi:glycosyltransferase family 2 protein [Methanocella conradii]|uniref:glycosyltransferase family 2 protein n=1 Tax=Methanocella conradii TaxID=1175444 RepID=UPI00157BBA23|nr:glycosyltransferase family 2 protein [Methanocella conradii]
MHSKVVIIILNWNGWKDTIECLESLYQIGYSNYAIILVDNGSEDESIEKIKLYCSGELSVESKFFKYDSSNKPIKVIEYTREEAESCGGNEKKIAGLPSKRKLILIKNEKNYGFAEGNNIGIRYALKALNPDYVLLLNNDTVVDPEFLSNMVKVAELDKTIGVLGPKICYYDVNGQNNVIACIGGKIDWKKYAYHIGENLKDSAENSVGVNECDWVSGTCLMLNIKEVPIKFLNNEFFFGCEDVDLCIRLKEFDYKCVTVLSSKIWHKGGQSRKKRYTNNIFVMMADIKTNYKFLKTHSKKYVLYFPLQVIHLFFHVIKKYIIKINNNIFNFYRKRS